MIKPTVAFDDLNNLEDRMISFEDDSVAPSKLTLVTFPKGRATIFFAGKLYDWYGREIELDERIRRIVAPFGHYTDGIDLSHCHDNFIVELKNGAYAICGIRYRRQKEHRENYDGLKYAITAGSLDMVPYIYANDLAPSYDDIDTETLKNTCFKLISDFHPGHSFALGKDPESTDFFMGNDVFVIIDSEVSGGNGWLWSCIANSRDDLLSASHDDDSELITPAVYQKIDYYYSFEISAGGDKLSVTFSDKHSTNKLRASTDKEVIEHLKSPELWWYLDPK